MKKHIFGILIPKSDSYSISEIISMIIPIKINTNDTK